MTQDNKNPTIVHFEIPADNVERAKKFYSTLFGWKIEKAEVKVEADTMDYWMISTSGDTNEKSSLGGGLMKRKDPQQPNLNYIGYLQLMNTQRKLRI
jgi:uncharacterized protein